MTALDPRFTWTEPSRSWLPSGMMMPTHLRSAASTSRVNTTSGKPGHVLRALWIVEIFGRERRHGVPLAQHLHRRIMLARDLRDDGFLVGLCEQAVRRGKRDGPSPRDARVEEVPAGDGERYNRIHTIFVWEGRNGLHTIAHQTTESMRPL